jgi:hypothetical protein
MDGVSLTCNACKKSVIISAASPADLYSPDSSYSSYIYTDAAGPRPYHVACKPAAISGSGHCYVCKAPASQEKQFVVYFTNLSLIAERAVCTSARCRAVLARETQHSGVDAYQECLGCRKTYSALATQCPNCGKQ